MTYKTGDFVMGISQQYPDPRLVLGSISYIEKTSGYCIYYVTNADNPRRSGVIEHRTIEPYNKVRYNKLLELWEKYVSHVVMYKNLAQQLQTFYLTDKSEN